MEGKVYDFVLRKETKREKGLKGYVKKKLLRDM